MTAEGEEALEQVEAILGANNQLFEIGKKSASKTVLSISVGQYLRENCSLDDYRFIFPGHRNIGARWARQRLRAMNVTPRLPTMFIEFIDALAQMVEDGQGIGPTMEYAVADSIAAGRVEALDIPLPPIRRLVARSPHAPEVAQAIEDMLCEVLTVSR